MRMSEIVIIAARRTATGAFQGALAEHSASDLGSRVFQALLKESDVDASDISQIIMGQVLTAGCGQNPARQSALNAGLPVDTQCLTKLKPVFRKEGTVTAGKASR